MFNARGNEMEANLPQGVPPDSGIYIGNLYTTPRTIANWRAKAEAYPKLILALRQAICQLEELAPEEVENPAEDFRAVLSALGEEA